MNVATTLGGMLALTLLYRQPLRALYLRVANGFDGVVRQAGGVYRSRKAGDGHGLGLESVRAAVARYDGQLTLSHDGATFTAEAILYLDG